MNGGDICPVNPSDFEEVPLFSESVILKRALFSSEPYLIWEPWKSVG